MKNRKTAGDYLALGLLAMLFGALVAPAIAAVDRARELANRSSCAANLRGLSQSMAIYAADNGDSFPFIGGTSNVTYDPAVKPDAAATTADDAITTYYSNKTYGNNPMAAMWLLVLKGQVAPKGFICRSDPFAGEPAPQQEKPVGNARAKFRLNFDSPKAESYSVAYMWGAMVKGQATPAPWWMNTSDSSMPIVSDMAPYLGAKAGPGEAMTQPAREQVATTSPTDPMVLSTGDTGAVSATAMSPNHQFDGQNVVFADCHAEFVRRADIGPQNDNMWTQTVDGKETYLEAGTLAQPLPVKTPPYDFVMVPMRSAKGELK